MRGDADDSVLRIARYRHYRADIGRSGYGDHIGHRRNLQAAPDEQNNRRENQADRSFTKNAARIPDANTSSMSN